MNYFIWSPAYHVLITCHQRTVNIQCIQKVFRPPSLFSILLCCSLILNLFKFIFFSLIYTPYLIMTKWKLNCRNVCKFIKKKKKLKFYSVLSWSTFGSNYSLKSFWVWCNKLCTPGLGDFLPFLFANPLNLSQVGCGTGSRQPFSDVSRDVR